MALRDIILQMNSYPEPTPGWALDNALALASGLGATLSVGVCQVRIPPASNWLADTLINAAGMIAAENRKSAENAQALLAQFSASASEDIRGEAMLVECVGMISHWQIASKARAYDLLVVPVHGHEQAACVEGLTFESGRPILLMTEDARNGAFDHVVVGWDGSRAAARALADALGFCAAARTVEVAVVTGDKDLSPAASVSDVVRHLGRHGITANAIEIPAAGRDAGQALQAYCTESESDLLVMGAYGHSRVREFVLGGATRSVLERPALSIFLSH